MNEAAPKSGVQNPAQTLADAVAWRPVLEPVLKAFEPLLSARAALVPELADCLRKSGCSLPEMLPGRAAQGVPLLAGRTLNGIAAPLRAAAEELLPLIGGIEAMAPHMPSLKAFFSRPVEPDAAEAEKGEARKLPDDQAQKRGEADARQTLAEAVVAGDRKAVARIAREAGVEPLILEFASAFVVSAALRAMTALALSDTGEAPWNKEGEAWRQGNCPVCGSLPSIAWLDKPVIDEKNAFLAGGGGKKHLHCGLCGADWAFRRGACPSCGQEGNGVIEILREDGPAHGERLDWCTKCKGYCPTVDLREREFVPDPDAAAMGMMHLDMVATRKKLRPLRPSFWNMF